MADRQYEHHQMTLNMIQKKLEFERKKNVIKAGIIVIPFARKTVPGVENVASVSRSDCCVVSIDMYSLSSLFISAAGKA